MVTVIKTSILCEIKDMASYENVKYHGNEQGIPQLLSEEELYALRGEGLKDYTIISAFSPWAIGWRVHEMLNVIRGDKYFDDVFDVDIDFDNKTVTFKLILIDGVS